MNTIRALIVDDEKNARGALDVYVKTYCPQVEVVGFAHSAKTAIAAIKNHKPDLVFLDVKMSGGDGFSVLEAFSKIDFGVIFVTGHNEYAVKAFRCSAIDFLQKPACPEELVVAVQKAIIDKENKMNRVKVDMLMANIAHIEHGPSRILVRDSMGDQIVKTEDIIYFEAASNYTDLYLVSGIKIISSKTIKHFDSLFEDSNSIVRVHKSYLANLSQVQHVAKDYQLIMSNGDEIDYSRGKREMILSFFKRSA